MLFALYTGSAHIRGRCLPKCLTFGHLALYAASARLSDAAVTTCTKPASSACGTSFRQPRWQLGTSSFWYLPYGVACDKQTNGREQVSTLYSTPAHSSKASTLLFAPKRTRARRIARRRRGVDEPAPGHSRSRGRTCTLVCPQAARTPPPYTAARRACRRPLRLSCAASQTYECIVKWARSYAQTCLEFVLVYTYNFEYVRGSPLCLCSGSQSQTSPPLP